MLIGVIPMATTASDAVDLLLASGIAVEVKSYSDAEIAGRHARIRTRQTSPSPSDVAAEREDRVVVYVVPRVTESLARLAADDADIAVVATKDGVVWWNRQRYEPEPKYRNNAAPRGRTPWARFGLVRALIRTRRPRNQRELATEVGVTQAAISQNLSRLADYARRSSDGWIAADPTTVVELFLTEYPGAGGITRYWYGLDPVIRQAQLVSQHGQDVLWSGDAAADLMVPWRTPRTAVVYAQTGLRLAEDGFAESTFDKATLAVIVPADPTIWHVAAAYARGRNRGRDRESTVDPLLCAYDVRQRGGSDSDQAIERLVRFAIEGWHRGD